MHLKVGIILVICAIATADFSYDGTKGPSHWEDDYATCKGKHQSPIDIDMLHVKKVKLPPLSFENFDTQPLSTTVTNNGHTVMFTVEKEQGKEPIIDGGPFRDGGYEFEQLHFHWGDNDSYGSEDSFNGKHFPMELHVVFYKQKYGSFENATNFSDGLAVLAFFFIITHKPNPSYVEVTKLLQQISEPDTQAAFEEPLALEDYLHTNMNDYYVYNGSTTTPPCLEVVTWLDFYEPIQISHKQLGHFRSLKDHEGNLLSHNFRPVQPIGDRIVWLTSDKFTSNELDLHDKIYGEKTKPTKKSKMKNNGRMIMSGTTILLSMIVIDLLL